MKPSFKLLNVLLITCICIIYSGKLYSQSQVIVNIQHPPYNQLNTEDIWKINLNNTTNDILSVYLFGTLSEDQAGLIATGTTSTFTLNPGMQKVNTHELTPISVDYPNPDMRYKESILRRGGVPTGNYEVCVSVRLSGTNEEVGSNCIEQSVEISTPVSLVTPDYGEKIFMQLPVFTWMHLKKPGDGANYMVTIVEILANQSPEVAIQTNPAWFTRDKINKTLLQYPTSARSFEHGKEYAWKVDVYEEGSLLTESDVGLFKYNHEENNQLDIIFPKIGEEIEVDAVNFEWLYNIQEDNSFSIKVVEVLNDQSPEAAIQQNTAFWEMFNILQTRVDYPETEPEFENGKTYAWQVSAFEDETLLAKSEVSTFTIKTPQGPQVEIIFPKVGEEIEVDVISFIWTYKTQMENPPSFSIKIVELLEDQTPQAAIQENTTFWEMINIQETSIQYPESGPDFEAGNKYAWQVSAFDSEKLLTKSDVQTFTIGKDESYNFDIIFPKVGEEIEVDGLYFQWNKYYYPESIILYSIKVVEVLDSQTPETAMEVNEYRIEKNGLEKPMYFHNSDLSNELNTGKYAWQIKAFSESKLLAESELSTFNIIASNE